MKNLFLAFIVLVVSSANVNSQLITSDQGDGTARTATDNYTNSFVESSIGKTSGNFSKQIKLGNVNSSFGLNFGLTMTYTSAITSGTNVGAISGELYGEGWNLNLPYVSVNTEVYNKYSVSEFNELVRPNNSARVDYSCEDLAKEGRVYWFSPTVNVPGVVNAKVNFHSRVGNTNEYLFIPNRIESYFELYLVDPGTSNPYWRLELPSGRVYIFSIFTITNNSAFGQKHGINNCGEIKNGILVNTYMPKTTVNNWFVSSIYVKNFPNDKIEFNYNVTNDQTKYKNIRELESRIKNYLGINQSENLPSSTKQIGSIQKVVENKIT